MGPLMETAADGLHVTCIPTVFQGERQLEQLKLALQGKDVSECGKACDPVEMLVCCGVRRAGRMGGRHVLVSERLLP